MIRQHYLKNTAILRTEMEDARGGRVEVIDFAPRFHQHGRYFAPVDARPDRAPAGGPAADASVRFDTALTNMALPNRVMSFGSHHIRAEGSLSYPLRLTTDAPITHVLRIAQPCLSTPR